MALTQDDIRLIETVFDNGFGRNFGPSIEHSLKTTGREVMIEVINEIVPGMIRKEVPDIVDPQFDALEERVRAIEPVIKDYGLRLNRLEKLNKAQA